MPDILDDDPQAYAAAVPDLTAADSADFEIHNEARRALRALNSLVFAHRGAPGLTVRSVMEHGAVADNATDNLAAFQATVDEVGASGGGIALVPPSANRFFWDGTLTVPAGVVLSGCGDRSVVRARIGTGAAGIQFAHGAHRGGLERLVLVGNERAPRGIGIDLTGAQFLRLRNFQVWGFEIGVRMSDGRTEFAAYNHLEDFEVNSCHVGIRAWMHCNQGSVREGRIWFCRNGGRGIGLDIHSATALAVAHVAVEDFDLGVRLRGLTRASLRDVYYESDVPGSGLPAGRWLDVRPSRGSIVRMDDVRALVTQSIVMAGSLEDAVTNDAISHPFSGAKRHHAAAPERNLVENGDFHRAEGLEIPGWRTNFSPVVGENADDFVTGGRSYDITQDADPNDGLATTFTVPETTDYVTVMVRYKNISSTGPLFTVISGEGPAAPRGQFADPVRPSATEWRVAAVTVELDQAAAGVVHVVLTADQSPTGRGQIRIDEVWAVVGATAAPPRAHAHRIEFLPEPVTLVSRVGLTQATTFPATGLIGLPGLAGAPRGAIGAVLSLRGVASSAGDDGSASVGTAMSAAVRPFVQEASTSQQWWLDLLFSGVEHERQVVLRGTSFVDGIDVFGDAASADYRVDVVGWMLPS